MLLFYGCYGEAWLCRAGTGACWGGKIEYKYVTITLDGKKTTLCFKIYHYQDRSRHLSTILAQLEAGEPVAIDQLNKSGTPPIKEALYFDLEGGRNFDVTRYLLMHGADVNVKNHPYACETTAAHCLCSAFWCRGEMDIRGLVLLLSYGAKLDMQDRSGRTPIDKLEGSEPWIPQALRKQYEETSEPLQAGPQQPLPAAKEKAPSAWKAHVSSAEQRRRKQDYFTKIAQALLNTEQHKPLNAAFVDYVAQAGIEARLVQQLSSRT